MAFLGIPTDFLLIVSVTVIAITFLMFFYLFKGVPVKVLYLRKNFSAREFKASENLDSTSLKILGKRNKVLKTLVIKGRPFEFQGGGMFRKRLFIANQGEDFTINPQELQKKDDPESISTTLAVENTEFVKEISGSLLSRLNKIEFKEKLLFILLGGGCGCGVTFFILYFFGAFK